MMCNTWKELRNDCIYFVAVFSALILTLAFWITIAVLLAKTFGYKLPEQNHQPSHFNQDAIDSGSNGSETNAQNNKPIIDQTAILLDRRAILFASCNASVAVMVPRVSIALTVSPLMHHSSSDRLACIKNPSFHECDKYSSKTSQPMSLNSSEILDCPAHQLCPAGILSVNSSILRTSSRFIPHLSTIPFTELYLNPFTDYADKEDYESETAQGSRHQYLLRQICGKVACTPRKDWHGSLRVCGETRNRTGYPSELGEWYTDSDSGASAENRQSLWHFDSEIAPERVDSFLFSENSGKIFFAETLENKESGGFSERILEKVGHFLYTPYCKNYDSSYTGGIPIENPPIKNGALKYWTTSMPLTANLTLLDLLLGLTIPRVGILTSGSSQSRKGKERSA